MSLYGGISFDGKPPVQPDPADSAPKQSEPASSAPVPSTSAAGSAQPGPTAGTEDKPKTSNSNWSAALRFAPTIRKKATAPSGSAAQAQARLRKAFGSASTDDAPTGNGASRIVGNAKPALNATALAAPTIIAAPAPVPTPRPPPMSTNTPARAPRILKAPALTLDISEEGSSDVNGFKQTSVGKKLEKKKGWNSKKGGGAREKDEFNGKYEPGRPCDYAAYKLHVQVTRAARRNQREAERERKRMEEDQSGSEGSDYESEDDDDRNREAEEGSSSKRPRLFAPPTSYTESPPPSVASPAHPFVPPASVHAPPKAESGEEAYARRLAMSQRPPQPPPQAPPPPSGGPNWNQAPPSTTSNWPQHAPPPQFQPPPPQFQGSSAPQPPQFQPSSVGSIGPSFVPSGGGIGRSFVPSGGGIGPSFVPSGGAGGGGDAAAKAREVALRLSRLAGGGGGTSASSSAEPSPPPQGPPPSQSQSSEPDNRPFAERLMTKYGWTSGSGLGANESGMTSALSVQSSSSNKGKKGKGAEGTSGGAPTGMGKGRGTIIDKGREERMEGKREKFGDPSRVVLLTNLCGPSDLDDDLGNEVAEEANKFGVVERCFVYLVPGEHRDDEAVRIFLVMSGLAGGYNAITQFDGRYFGGRVVKARYYDETMFMRGEHRL
ncbi:hypothetical protein T439DRAFT_376927 [Meredithblackwellia eburnea MCA 4105]